MILAWSTPDVYAAEKALLAGLAEGELMGRAVAGLVAVARARLDARSGQRVTALVGPGNNGADALYAAAALAEEGAAVDALVTGTVHAGALAAARAAGVRVAPGWAERDVSLGEPDLVLDGITGIGGRPGLPEGTGAWVDGIPAEAYVLAVDLPSGHDPAGSVLNPDGVFADETVTFSVAKPLHLLSPTEPAVGMLTVVDIGLTVEAPAAVARLTADDVPGLWPVPGAASDKYSRGVLGIVAGSEAYTGAAVLACTAAVTAGAGMVRYVGPAGPEALVRALVPEAVHGAGRVQAWVVGPGLDAGDLDPTQRDVAQEALASDLPVLLDAGGLDLLDRPRDAPTLLTPHAGECARMLSRLEGGDLERAAVEAAPLAHARRLAAATGATVLLKGSNTLVVGPDPHLPVLSQRDAPAWLATAGAGDVLAGLCGVLLAGGLAPDLAGGLGSLVHGRAAELANPGGPVRARDVARALGPAVAGLLR